MVPILSMKGWLVLISCVFWIVSVQAADSPAARLAAAKHYVELIDYPKRFESRAMGLVKQLPEKEQAKISEELMRMLGSEKILEEIVKIHADQFSLEELKALTACYASPLGQGIVRKMSEVDGKTMKLVTDEMQTLFLQMLLKKGLK